jgi:hypothetical protein
MKWNVIALLNDRFMVLVIWQIMSEFKTYKYNWVSMTFQIPNN